ncbi:MAG: hypothetical protein LBI96_04960 [Odoribacteraceae bacterium]|nr:hypothetical protein [Odoribacteraceae bacterium]
MASTSSATGEVASTGSATAATTVAEPIEATITTTTIAVAEPVEAQTTKANNHDGGGTGYKPAPAKDIFRQIRRGAPACAPFPACAPLRFVG